ncbi:probable long-chain-alcohol O-fatty-acyltransferase 5 [Rutidosis leptorrhynchoides]|uniref:probable long-chain-alcohol O-fatty-acyltransferase 5 n=1 Tax=Rutidosis leptorrhynchoides TaxID=125765 RepID=UPI003A9970F0
MEGETKNMIFVWATACVSLFYCHKITTFTTPGTTGLCTFLPVICIFFYLPLVLTTVHFSGTTSFFLTWLANFKLILFAFNKGPLYSISSPLPLYKFILTACVPIKITTEQKVKSSPAMILNYSIKFTIFVLLLKVYEYGDYFNPIVKMALFCVHIYVVLDVGLAIVAYVARVILGFDLEPQFNEPYLATSLQDFWGKRWNLMVTGILHPTVYLPIRKVSGRYLSKKLAPFPAVMGSFIVSGLMHELIFYYIGRLKPTWEVTCFFFIHGLLVSLELMVKRAVGDRFRVPGIVSGPVALGVVMATSFWLFFPPFLRCDTEVRSCKEFVAFLELLIRGRFVGPNDVSCPYYST